MNRRGFFATLCGAIVAGPLGKLLPTLRPKPVNNCILTHSVYAKMVAGTFGSPLYLKYEFKPGHKIGETIQVRKPYRFRSEPSA